MHNTRTGGGNHYAIGNRDVITNWAGVAVCSGAFTSPDYNAFYVADDINNMGEWLGNSHTFASWQTTSTQDANSLNINALAPLMTPLRFKNISKGDLHVDDTGTDAENVLMQKQRLCPLTYEDIDGEFRRGPDIGVDEVENTLVFVGPTDDWHDANNWDLKVVPSCADNVLINAQNVKIYAINSTAYCYSLTIAPTFTLEIETGAKLENCWLKGTTTLPYTATHNGFIDIQTGATFIANNATIDIAGEFSNSGTFTKGNSTTEMNFDRPTIFSCLADYIESFNNKSTISNISGSANTNFHNLNIINNGTTTMNNANIDKIISVGDATTDLGDLDIQGTGWLFLNGNRLTIEGNLKENTGTIAGSALSDFIINGKDALTGTIKLRANNGSDNQFRNLRVNRSNKGTMTFSEVANSLSSVIVNTQLQLDNGILRMGIANPLTNILLNITSNLSNTSTGAVINYLTSGGSSGTSWIHGRIQRAIDGATDKNYGYPVGDATQYELIRADIKAGFTATTITGYFNPAGASGTPALVEAGYTYDGVCPTGFWNLSPTGFTTGTYDIEVFPVGITCAGARPTFAKSPDGAGTWTFDGSTYVNATKRTGFTSFSDIALIKEIIILPVTWLSFKGETIKENKILMNSLHWQTSAELNAKHFDIERSIDGKNFVKIGQIAANGTTNILNSYNFIDKNPKKVSYYRLAQVDLDGKINYSIIISLAIKELRAEPILYPNPTTDVLHIFVPNTETEKAKVEIYDMLGRLMFSENIILSNKVVDINTQNLKKGVYQVILSTSQHQYSIKTVIAE